MSLSTPLGVAGSRPLHSLFTIVLFFFIHIKGSSCQTSGTLSLPFSGWYGNDGSWSTVHLYLGTPAQDVYVIVSTLLGENWVIDAAHGCSTNVTAAMGSSVDSNANTDPEIMCIMNRGQDFNDQQSKTFKAEGPFVLNTRTELGMGGQGFYGTDVFQLGNVSVQNQVVAAIATPEYEVGQLGLSALATNFTGSSVPALITALHQNNSISSRSFGYHVGASYKEKKAPGSAILGGWDTGRFTPNNPEVSFQLEDEVFPWTNLRTLTINGFGSKQVANSASGLTGDGIKVLIDSTTPFLWLPEKLCTLFEEALSLEWDEDSKLYLLNSTQASTLQASEGFVEFTLGDEFDKTVTLKIPFPAFALSGSSPFLPNGSTAYFPLQRAKDEDQYTLGRAFLQEVYLRVNFDHGNFTLNQASFDGGGEIVEAANAWKQTTSANDTQSAHSGASDKASSKNNTPIILGVVLGGVGVALVSLSGILFVLRRRKNARKQAEIHQIADREYTEFDNGPGLGGGKNDYALEIGPGHKEYYPAYHTNDFEADHKTIPESSDPFHELAGQSPPRRNELPSYEPTHGPAYARELPAAPHEEYELP